MLISEYSWAVARAAASAFFLWLLARLGTEVVMGMGVCTMFMGEFSGRLSSWGLDETDRVGEVSDTQSKSTWAV